MSTLEDRIKRALAKKPSANMSTPPKNKIIGRRSNVTRNAEHPSMRPIPEPNESTIYITGSVVGISGYDNFVYETIRGLKSVGADVRINSLSSINTKFCPDWFKSIHMNKLLNVWNILIMPPCQLDRWAIDKKTIIYTMWETDYLDPFWVKQLNNSAFVIVPSQWAIECFKESGVTVPIYKIPLGYDPLIFYPEKDFPNTITFGTAAALTAGGLRKNTYQIIDMFQKAFPNKEDVKLKIKVTPICPEEKFSDKRIEIERKMLPPLELASWYRSISAFVNASYAEGFGLHLIEAMACGRPVISTAYSAVTEYFDETVGWKTDHKIVEAKGGFYSGNWGQPIDESFIDKMRYVYHNREELKAKGENAFFRARNYTWKDMGKTLIKLLLEQEIVKL